MNLDLVKQLILKDWYFQRLPLAMALVGTVVGLLITALGGRAGAFLGLLLLITVVIAFGSNMAIASIVNERKEQTLPFVMSLPISYREYTASKIVGNMALFLVVWLVVTGGTVGLLLWSPEPRGLVPYVLIMAVEMLVSTCLIVTVAIISESQPWTIAAVMVGNLAVNGVGYFVAHIGSIAGTMWGSRVVWSFESTGLLAAELAALALLITFSFVSQARKKDFL